MAESFATVQQYKDYTDATLTDPEIQTSLDVASELVRRYCEREFDFEAGVMITLDGSEHTGLVLPSPPIRKVISVTESGTLLVEGTDFAVIGAPGILRRLTGSWCAGILNVAVVYDRGYDIDGTYPGLPPAPLPAPIAAATLSIARRVAASGTLPTGGMQSETQGQYSYTLADPATAAVFSPTADERRMLDPWRMQGLA